MPFEIFDPMLTTRGTAANRVRFT